MRTNDSTVTSFAEDDYGVVWAFSGSGLSYFNDATDQFQEVSLGNVGDQLGFIDYVGENKFWLLSEGIYEFSVLEGGKISNPQRISDFNHQITSIVSIGSDSKYLGTIGKGIVVASKEHSEWVFKEVYYSQPQQTVEAMPFSSVDFLHNAGDREIWISANGNVYLLKSSFFQNVAALPYYNTYAISESEAGSVYVCMGEVFKLKSSNGAFEKDHVYGLNDGFISGVSARGENVWFSDTKGNLELIIDGKLKREFKFEDRGGSIFFIYQDIDGNLWACQAPGEKPIFGLIKVTKNYELEFYEEEKGLPNRVLVVKNGPDGTLYCGGIGANTYLYKYNSESDRFENLSKPLNFIHDRNFEVHDLAVDKKGTIWMASTHGLLKQDSSGLQRQSLGAYTNNEIRSVLVGKDGAIWLSTDTEGVLYYKNGEYVHFGRESGLPSEVMAYRSLLIDAKGYLWVGTAQGTVRSWRGNPTPNITPKPIIQHLKMGEETVSMMKDAQNFKYGSHLNVSFQSPAFPAEGIEYQTRLLGITDRWSLPSQKWNLIL